MTSKPHTAADARIGVLSSTLSSSTSVRWILPARIRCPTHNDVIFVGETSIQVREFIDTANPGLLTSPFAKLDLGFKILAAKVVSATLELVANIDAILGQTRDEDRFSINGKPVAVSTPPQILVVSLSSAELAYVYAKTSVSGTTKLVFAKRAILGGVTVPSKYGKHLAVDPEYVWMLFATLRLTLFRSQAIAVAPSFGYFCVQSLKNVEEIRHEIDDWDPRRSLSFCPVKEVMTFGRGVAIR